MNVFGFLAGNLSVDVNGAVTESTVAVGLFETGGYIVKTGFLNVEFPFDPLICGAELVALDLVELDNVGGRRIGQRRVSVPLGIDGGRRFKIHILGLAAHGIVLGLGVLCAECVIACA